MKTKSKTFQSIYNDIDSMLAEVEAHQLEPALAYLQSQHIPIYYASGVRAPIDLWAPKPLPIELRRTIRRHKETIAERMHQGATDVCPNPALHRKHQKRGVCQICKRIEPSLEQVSPDVVLSSACEEVSRC